MVGQSVRGRLNRLYEVYSSLKTEDNLNVLLAEVGRYSCRVALKQHGVDPDEISQRATIKVWQNLGKFNSRQSKFSTWCYKITLNCLIDVAREIRKNERPYNDAVNNSGTNCGYRYGCAVKEDSDLGGLRKTSRGYRRPEPKAQQIRTPLPEVYNESMDFDWVEELHLLVPKFEELVRALPNERDREILWALQLGYKPSGIARYFGTNSKAISNRIQKLKTHLKEKAA